MLDPVTMQRLAEIRQREYLEAAKVPYNAVPVRTMLTNVGDAMIALGKRLMATTQPAPARTVTAPDITAEPCVEC